MTKESKFSNHLIFFKYKIFSVLLNDPLKILFRLKVTELLSCFVDAHFTHITLSSEAQEIIADLLQMVESQVSFSIYVQKLI